jgi:hypothetical protein
MKIDLKGIIEGVRNKVAPPEELKGLIEETFQERYAICSACPENSSNKYPGKTFIRGEHCTKCGCKLSLKLRCLSCNCPLSEPKWVQKITKEDDEHVKALLNGNS